MQLVTLACFGSKPSALAIEISKICARKFAFDNPTIWTFASIGKGVGKGVGKAVGRWVCCGITSKSPLPPVILGVGAADGADVGSTGNLSHAFEPCGSTIPFLPMKM
jgi:hypothetical protein